MDDKDVYNGLKLGLRGMNKQTTLSSTSSKAEEAIQKEEVY